jgi:hypothetical protein
MCDARSFASNANPEAQRPNCATRKYIRPYGRYIFPKSKILVVGQFWIGLGPVVTGLGRFGASFGWCSIGFEQIMVDFGPESEMLVPRVGYTQNVRGRFDEGPSRSASKFNDAMTPRRPTPSTARLSSALAAARATFDAEGRGAKTASITKSKVAQV